MLLAADVGGTNTRFALFSEGGTLRRRSQVANDEVASFDAALSAFLAQEAADAETLGAAAIGVAAPVAGRVATLTNRAWTVDADAIAQRLGAPVALANDLEILAEGVFAPTAFQASAPPLVLRDRRRTGVRGVVVATGTGLGATFAANHTGLPPVLFPSEAGHVLAPAFDDQAAHFHKFLAKRLDFPLITVEHVTRGRALSDGYAFFAKREVPTEPAEDPNRAVVRRALDDGDEAALAAVLLYVDTVAVALRDLAVLGIARSGVYIGGSIVTSLAPLLEAAIEVRFDEPHPMATLLSDVPVFLITDGDAALRGAASMASRLTLQNSN